MSKNLDVMLGSWQGLREGILHITHQTTLAVQAAWENTKQFFTVSLLEIEGIFIDAWHAIGETSIKHLMPSFAQFFIWLQRKAAEARGIEWRLTPAEERKIISEDQSRALGALARLRTENETRTNEAIRKRRSEHERRLAAIGAASLDETKKWEDRLGALPTLSAQFWMEWNRDSKAATSVSGAMPGIPSLSGAGGTGATGTKLAGAASKGTAEAYSRIVQAMVKRDDPQKEVAKNTAKIAESSEKTAEATESFATWGSQFFTDIPGG